MTDLNPQLRGRQLGAVETFTWKSVYQDDASGFLTKPVDYQPGKRYPLVILLDDGFLGQKESPYMLDAAGQLSGHAIQMLAAEGFVVLYAREPRGLPIGTPEEGRWMRAHIESAVHALDRAGLVDPVRIGISGFSRAAYLAEYLLIHSTIPFAAATAVDGGSLEYTDRLRPFYDHEIQSICTPLMIESHGLATLAAAGSLADRMNSFGKAVEVLYFAKAPHDVKQPRHRFRSLNTHIDWWRFWLKDEEDLDPAKHPQYGYWRQLRQAHTRALQNCLQKADQ